MGRLHWFVWGAIAGLAAAGGAQAQATFSGFYGGLEGGLIMYSTHITFDGVDDPAGRSGGGYGGFVGYNYRLGKGLVGGELVGNWAAPSDPYTFDPAVVGFSELEVRRGFSAGLEVRVGYLVIERVLLYGNVGYSRNHQDVRIDGVPLAEAAGGASAQDFGTFQVGAGLEAVVHPHIGVRASFRTLAGYDLETADFGTIPRDASLTFFDVEPRQQQLFAGLVFHW